MLIRIIYTILLALALASCATGSDPIRPANGRPDRFSDQIERNNCTFSCPGSVSYVDPATGACGCSGNQR